MNCLNLERQLSKEDETFKIIGVLKYKTLPVSILSLFSLTSDSSGCTVEIMGRKFKFIEESGGTGIPAAASQHAFAEGGTTLE